MDISVTKLIHKEIPTLHRQMCESKNALSTWKWLQGSVVYPGKKPLLIKNTEQTAYTIRTEHVTDTCHDAAKRTGPSAYLCNYMSSYKIIANIDYFNFFTQIHERLSKPIPSKKNFLNFHLTVYKKKFVKKIYWAGFKRASIN